MLVNKWNAGMEHNPGPDSWGLHGHLEFNVATKSSNLNCFLQTATPPTLFSPIQQKKIDSLHIKAIEGSN